MTRKVEYRKAREMDILIDSKYSAVDAAQTWTDKYPYCGEVDDVEHTLYSCVRWKGERDKYSAEMKKTFNAMNMMQSLLASEKGWQVTNKVICDIMLIKEKEGREVN